MAFVFHTKSSVLISFAMYGYIFGQCLKKTDQKALCENIEHELGKSQILIKRLKKCLEVECIKTSLSDKNDCMNPPKKTIPGFNTTRIDKTLTIEDFLQDILKRIVSHQIHSSKIKRYFKSVKCYNKTRLVGFQLNLIKTWINKTQRDLGFSTVTQSGKPKLTSTGATSRKEWYYMQIQMLINMNHDFADMGGYFQNSTMNKTCIIPAC